MEEWFVSQIPYERIVIAGRGYISTEAIQLLSDHNVNIILVDSFGRLLANINHVMSSHAGTKYRIGQYDTFRKPEKVLYLQKHLLTAKLQSQINFFTLLNNDKLHKAVLALLEYKNQTQLQNDKRGLLTIESRSGHIYFNHYAKLFPPRYNFDSRHGGGLVLSNRYASDIINALLNYGYAVLAAEISKFVNGFGLDPYYGFMHKSHDSFQALVYDIIEPFRWLVEYAVYKLVVEEERIRGHITIRRDQYAWNKQGRIILDSGLIRTFLDVLERMFQNERLYKFKHGIKRKDGLSMCQEITIAKINVQQLADYCIGKEQF